MEHNNLQEFFTNEKTLEFDKMVEEYVAEHGMSPFTNIDLKDEETGEVQIDMEKSFNESVEKKFSVDLDEVLSDYVIALITSFMKENV